MDHIGIDVHKRESQTYILAAGGERVVDINALSALAPLPRAPVLSMSAPSPACRIPAGAAGTAHTSLRAR